MIVSNVSQNVQLTIQSAGLRSRGHDTAQARLLNLDLTGADADPRTDDERCGVLDRWLHEDIRSKSANIPLKIGAFARQLLDIERRQEMERCRVDERPLGSLPRLEARVVTFEVRVRLVGGGTKGCRLDETNGATQPVREGFVELVTAFKRLVAGQRHGELAVAKGRDGAKQLALTLGREHRVRRHVEDAILAIPHDPCHAEFKIVARFAEQGLHRIAPKRSDSPRRWFDDAHVGFT